MALDIEDLVTPPTADEVLASLLSVAAALGLSTTSWQSGQPSHTILRLVANVIASTMSVVSTITRGGLLDWAGSVTPEYGPGWLDVLVATGWSTVRRPATYATTDVTIATTAACIGGTYAAGAFRVARGAVTYSNASTIIIPAGVGSVTGSFVAAVAGSAPQRRPEPIPQGPVARCGPGRRGAGPRSEQRRLPPNGQRRARHRSSSALAVR